MSSRHDPIRDATGKLAREVPPTQDLWPDIAARLDEEPASPAIVRPVFRRRWGWMAAAAVLTLMVLIPSLQTSDVPADVAELDHDYAAVRNDVAALTGLRCGQLPATSCASLLDGLALLDRTADGLSSALSTLPDDAPERPALLARYRSTLTRAQDLRSRVERL